MARKTAAPMEKRIGEFSEVQTTPAGEGNGNLSATTAAKFGTRLKALAANAKQAKASRQKRFPQVHSCRVDNFLKSHTPAYMIGSLHHSDTSSFGLNILIF